MASAARGSDLPVAAPVLADGQVRLRPHRREDLDGLVEQGGDPQTRRWTDVPVPYLRSDGHAYLVARDRGWATGTELALAAELDGRYAGTVWLTPDGAGAAWLGCVTAPWARGRGVATSSVRLLLGWAFQALDLDAVHWAARVGNWPARRVSWAVGFRVEGPLRSWLPATTGGRCDAWVGTLLPGEPLWPAHPWLVPPVLTGPAAARLRPHTEADVPRIVQACSDPSTRHWLSSLPTPYLAEDARKHLHEIAEQHAGGRSLYWAIADPGTDLLIGEIGVFGLGGRAVRGGEIGYWAHPSGRGRGATTAALRLALRHALLPTDVGGLGLARVVVRAASGNRASRQVAVSAGMRECGVDRRAELLRDGTVDDLVRYERVADDLTAADGTAPDGTAADGTAADRPDSGGLRTRRGR